MHHCVRPRPPPLTGGSGAGTSFSFNLGAIAQRPTGMLHVAPDPISVRASAPLVLLLLALALPVRAQGVVLNELLASNQATLPDPDFDDYGDWIELYNGSEEAVDLGGHFLTDDPDEPQQWRIPDGTTLAPGAFLLVWADDEDAGPPETEALHANFKLSAGGESVSLVSPAGDVVDTITFGEQTTDISFGRVPDGAATWDLFAIPTPGAANDTPPGGEVAAAPVLSLESGFYGPGESLSMTTPEADATIRYTLDGSPPTESSPAYTAPLALTATTVIRAASFAPDRAQSPEVARALFVGESSTLPVVSLVSDPDGFFSDERGIYVEGTNGIPGRCRTYPVNWNQDWEREALVSVFEPGADGELALALEQRAGVQIFGGCSRIYPQKSLSLHARGRYGTDAFEHRFFPDLDIETFDDLILRSSAQDWWRTMFRDGMIQTLTRHMDLDGQAYRPALVFLNGEFWGIHNIREKLNEDWVTGHYGHPDDEVELIEGTWGGQSEHYDEITELLESGDPSTPEVFAEVQARIDVDQYLNYLIAEIYAANGDWPGNNLKLWRPRTPDGRWRWMLFDTDFGFGGNGSGQATSNTLALATDPDGSEWPNPPWSTFLFRSLLQNDGFRHTFVQRLAAHAATTFEPDHTIAVIDSLQANIAAEIPRHKLRWPQSISFGASWDALVEIMRDFARRRPLQVRGHVVSQFADVTGAAQLSLSVEGGGEVHIEGVPMPRATPDDPFLPILYTGVPAQITAVPDEGYVFAGWRGLSDAAADTLALTLTDSGPLTATFVLATDTEAGTSEPTSRLHLPFPNPARGSATVEATLARGGPLSVRVVDMLGREVATLAEGRQPAGTHRLTVDAAALAGGVYSIVMEAEGYRASRRLVVAH